MTDSRKPVVTVLTAPGEPAPPGIEAVRARAEVRFACDEPTLRESLPGTDVMMVTDFRTEALEAAWPCADKLQWIHATSAGVDALMFPALIKSDVVVTNARGIFDRTIAEYVLCTILMFAKDFPRSIRLQMNQEWKHRDTERAEGKQVLVVGAGSIGRQIGRLVNAIGLHAHGIARTPRHDDPDFVAVHGNDELYEQLSHADFVVIAAPLTPQTEGLFDAKAFAAMKKTARLINIGRGPVLDVAALAKRLEAGQLRGAVLDVFPQEPLAADSPYWTTRNLIVTPHSGLYDADYVPRCLRFFFANVERYLDDRPLENRVDTVLGY